MRLPCGCKDQAVAHGSISAIMDTSNVLPRQNASENSQSRLIVGGTGGSPLPENSEYSDRFSIINMAKSPRTIPQNYPRIQDENSPYYGCLDDSRLVTHNGKIPAEQLKSLIRRAIMSANRKSSREILSIPPDAAPERVAAIYESKGRELFRYFKKYVGDPASTAHQIYGKHYRAVGIEQFRNRTLQKERMNSGWRYQYLAVDCARHSQRFNSVSDIGAAEGDFNAIIEFLDQNHSPLRLYVSVKNRSNTLGGQDWPKAIEALERVAKTDKNAIGPYCCVFGIAMDRGMRYIKREQKSKVPHSVNTEVWLSDYFWPFFANYSYEEIMTLVLDVLISSYEAENLSTEVEIPDALLDSFGAACAKAGLVDENGIFNDPYRLVHFFVNK